MFSQLCSRLMLELTLCSSWSCRLPLIPDTSLTVMYITGDVVQHDVGEVGKVEPVHLVELHRWSGLWCPLCPGTFPRYHITIGDTVGSCIVRMDYQCIFRQDLYVAGATGHRTGIVMFQFAVGGDDVWIVFPIRIDLFTLSPWFEMEFALTAFEVRYAIFCSCAIGFHRPLLALFTSSSSPDFTPAKKGTIWFYFPVPSEDGNQAVEAHMGHYLTDDLVRPAWCAGQGFPHRIHPLDAWRSPIGEGPASFQEGWSRKMTSACLVVSGMEDSDHQQVEVVERLPSPAGCSGRFVPHLSPISHNRFFSCPALHPTSPEFSTPLPIGTERPYAVRIFVHLRVVGTGVSCSLMRLTSHIGCSLTLFWLAKRVHTHPPRPIFPVIMARSAMSMTVKVPCECSVTPTVEAHGIAAVA